MEDNMRMEFGKRIAEWRSMYCDSHTQYKNILQDAFFLSVCGSPIGALFLH